MVLLSVNTLADVNDVWRRAPGGVLRGAHLRRRQQRLDITDAVGGGDAGEGSLAVVAGEVVDLKPAIEAHRLERLQDKEHVFVAVAQRHLLIAAMAGDGAPNVAEVRVKD